MTAEIPAVVRTTIAALRTAATWLPDEQRDLLYEAATVAENGGWEDACCPICQETWCDAGCPLEDFRGEMLCKAEQAAQCDGRHPLVWPDRTQTYLYDLVSHPGCSHQPWARPERAAEADGANWPGTPGHTLPAWEAFRMPVPIALNPPYQRPVLPDGCYDASFGRVHVRPGCRC